MKFLRLSLFAFLLALPATSPAANAPLVAHAPIEITGARGGFDGLLVDTGADRLLLSHIGNGTLDVLDLRTEKIVKLIKTGLSSGVAMDVARDRYYVALSREKKLLIISRNELEALGSVSLPGPASVPAAGPKGMNRVFVGEADGTNLWVVDPVAKTVASTVTIPAGPGGMVAEDDTSRIYLNVRGDDTMQLISASDNNSTVGAAWPAAPAKKAFGITMDTRGERRLFVAGINGKLAVLRASDGQRAGSADTVTGVGQIAFDPGKERLYCPGAGGRMTVLDTSNNRVTPLGDMVTARGARVAAVDPKRNSVWIAYTENGRSYARKFTLPARP